MSSPLLRNVLYLASVQGAGYVIPLITLPYLVRVLGPADYGRIGFSISFVQYLVLFTEFGFNLSATKSIAASASSRTDISRIFWNVSAGKMALALGSGFALGLLALTVPRLQQDQAVLAATYLNVLGTVLFPIWLFQGLQKMALIAACSIVARMLTIPLIFLLVHSSNDVVLVAALQAGSSVLAGLLAIGVICRLKLISWQKPTFSGIVEALKESSPLFVSVAAISLFTNTNVVVLGFVSTDRTVGQFVAADKIRQAVQGLINPISQSVYPRICSLISADPQAAYRLIRRLFAYQGIGTFILSTALCLFAKPIVALVLGSKFGNAVDVLRILSFLPFVIGLSNVFGIQTMLPLGMNRTFRNVLITSGLLNIVLLIPLGSWFGAEGAAAAILATESAVTLFMAIVLIRLRVPIFFAAEEMRVEV